MTAGTASHIQSKRLIACDLLERVSPLYSEIYQNKDVIRKAVRLARAFSNGELPFATAQIHQSDIQLELNRIRESEAQIESSHMVDVVEARHAMLRHTLDAAAWLLSNENDEALVLSRVAYHTARALAQHVYADALYSEINYAQLVSSGDSPVDVDKIPHLSTSIMGEDITMVGARDNNPTDAHALAEVMSILNRSKPARTHSDTGAYPAQPIA